MSYKDILLQADPTEDGKSRLAVAVALAKQFEAHLIGIFLRRPPRALALGMEESMFVGPAQVEGFAERLEHAWQAEADEAETLFRAALDKEGLAGEWRAPEGSPAETLALHARYADLLVMGQVNPDHPERSGDKHLADHVLLASGRPVLIIPYAGHFEQVGRNVVVAWNGSREATRAVHDALPILTKADSVTVLSVNPEKGVAGDGALPAADLAMHLARHGIKVNATHTTVEEISVADELLNRAFDLGADLIVSGGYGHSRLREVVLSGVTRALLQHMTIPVLMSH